MATIACRLTDSISVSAVLHSVGEIQTQPLEVYSYLLSQSYVQLERENIFGRIWSETPEALLRKSKIEASGSFSDSQYADGALAEAVKVRIYLNDKKVEDVIGVPETEENDSQENSGLYGF